MKVLRVFRGFRNFIMVVTFFLGRSTRFRLLKRSKVFCSLVVRVFVGRFFIRITVLFRFVVVCREETDVYGFIGGRVFGFWFLI